MLTSLLVWVLLDTYEFQRASVIGAVQGMITGLVCITPAAGIARIHFPYEYFTRLS
jgi:Amt family ammonium transporter